MAESSRLPWAATASAMSFSATAIRSSGKSARPPTPMTRVQAGSASRSARDVGRVGADQRGQVGAVDEEQLVGHPDPVEPVGEVDQILQLVGGDEEQSSWGRPAART